jgi:uroporphyrinogen-III decarboxylase
VVKELEATDTPLIGFAGAPFTVASYLVEGGPSREFALIKTMMHTEPLLFDLLLERLSDITISFLRAQVAHGARALQLFDSWAGALTRDEYRRFALPATERVIASVADLGVPTILFGVGTGELLDLMSFGPQFGRWASTGTWTSTRDAVAWAGARSRAISTRRAAWVAWTPRCRAPARL